MQIENDTLNSVLSIQPPLAPAARSALRARAHILDPVVMISSKGLSDAVVAEINRSLTSHELIKIRVLDTDRAEREALLAQVCARTGAAAVQHIGKILVVYRQNLALADEEAPRPTKPAPPVRRRVVDAPRRRAPIATAGGRRRLSR